jgi:hypothetical protein
MKQQAHRCRSLWNAFIVAGMIALALGGVVWAAPDLATCECPSTPGAVEKAVNLGIPFLAAVSGDPPDIHDVSAVMRLLIPYRAL